MVWIEASRSRLARPPTESDVGDRRRRRSSRSRRRHVVFTAPLADDDRRPDRRRPSAIQFSRDMDGRTFGATCASSYIVTAPAAPPPPAMPPRHGHYGEGNRALELKFAQPLERFRTVKVELLEGITAIDGQPLAPWSMTFTIGRNSGSFQLPASRTSSSRSCARDRAGSWKLGAGANWLPAASACGPRARSTSRRTAISTTADDDHEGRRQRDTSAPGAERPTTNTSSARLRAQFENGSGLVFATARVPAF